MSQNGKTRRAARSQSLAAWRKAQQIGEEMTLPECGLHVRLRRVKILDLVLNGDIPQTLDALVKKAGAGNFGVNEIRELAPLIDMLTRLCLLEPPISDVADGEHITLEEIPIADRLFIFGWANSAANALAPFRGQPAAAAVEPGSDRPDV